MDHWAFQTLPSRLQGAYQNLPNIEETLQMLHIDETRAELSRRARKARRSALDSFTPQVGRTHPSAVASLAVSTVMASLAVPTAVAFLTMMRLAV